MLLALDMSFDYDNRDDCGGNDEPTSAALLVVQCAQAVDGEHWPSTSQAAPPNAKSLSALSASSIPRMFLALLDPHSRRWA